MRNTIRGRRNRRINYKKMMLSMALVVLIVALVFFGIGRMTKSTVAPEVEKDAQVKQEEVIVPEDKTFNMVAIGDIMCHSTNFNAAYDKQTKEYDFSPVFTNVAKYITKADISIRKFRNNICRRSKRI